MWCFNVQPLGVQSYKTIRLAALMEYIGPITLCNLSCVSGLFSYVNDLSLNSMIHRLYSLDFLCIEVAIR